MQVLTCILSEHVGYIQAPSLPAPLHHDPGKRNQTRARAARDPSMVTPVIILGALMVFVFWDTSETK
jgi:hypothetical protein